MAELSSADSEKILILGRDLIKYLHNIKILNSEFARAMAYGQFQLSMGHIDSLKTLTAALGGLNPAKVQGFIEQLGNTGSGLPKCTAQIDGMREPYNYFVGAMIEAKVNLQKLRNSILKELKDAEHIETDAVGLAAAFRLVEDASRAHKSSAKILKFSRKGKKILKA